jgi:hypothetical protein
LLSLLGLVVGTTPMVLFVASTLNSSALETTAGVACAAALLRLSRGRPEGWAWLALAGSGVLLALSRTTGPLWIVLDVGLFVAFVGAADSGRSSDPGRGCMPRPRRRSSVQSS